ncbi:MAG: alpha-amylase family glycosyl hydrolase, partial [Erysipelotrichaceae bacterium]
MRKVERFEAHLDDYGLITIFLSNQFYNGQSSIFYLKKADKSMFKCQILSFELSSNDYKKYMIQTTEEILIGLDYEIIEEHGLRTYLQYSLITKTQRFDQDFYYEGDDLGVHPYNDHTDFALWAPTASRVMVEIFKERSILIEMNKTDKGVYRAILNENGHGLAYIYHVYVNGGWQTSTDPIARSATSNNQKSVIVDYTQIPIENYSHCLPVMKQTTDAIIYEISVRDFTAQAESNVVNRSKFLGLTELNTHNPEKGLTGLSYIKDLGVTHVQIMPMYDFATIDEDNPSVFYNWGYDPQQFNIPEGSYSTDPSRPLTRISEIKQMIQAFHQQGIRVVMDVVYNHVYDMEASAFEKIVPYYYFRRSISGAISN